MLREFFSCCKMNTTLNFTLWPCLEYEMMRNKCTFGNVLGASKAVDGLSGSGIQQKFKYLHMIELAAVKGFITGFHLSYNERLSLETENGPSHEQSSMCVFDSQHDQKRWNFPMGVS